jgi:uncharacterized protein
MTSGDKEQLAYQAMESGNYEVALPLLKALVEINSVYALLSLGWIYEEGTLGPPDKAAARSFYEHAAQLGSAEAYGRLGSLLLDQEQQEQAEAAYKQGAKLGDEHSKLMLEKLTDNVQEKLSYEAIEVGDFNKAHRLLEPLAARNSISALLNLGWIYETGKLAPPKISTAISYYERAAREGSSEAYRRIGQLLLDQGHHDQARLAFKHGADAGNISCMYWLGKMMVEGQGGLAEITQGSAWLEKAATQGHFFAKRMLLALEGQDAGSIGRKLLAKVRIAALAKDVFKEFLRNPDSDKIR